MFTKIITPPFLALTAALLGIATGTPIAANINGNPTVARGALASGRFTHYTPGLGACGQTHSESELVVALSYADSDPYTPNGNPNNNSLCGKRLRACAPLTMASLSMSPSSTAAPHAPRARWISRPRRSRSWRI